MKLQYLVLSEHCVLLTTECGLMQILMSMFHSGSHFDNFIQA